jgi:hypothetical protein
MKQPKADETIPLPPKRQGNYHRCGRKLKYPWDLLDRKGKSMFMIDLEQAAIATGAKQYWSKRVDGAKFETRSCVENDIKGVRVWRVQ